MEETKHNIYAESIDTEVVDDHSIANMLSKIDSSQENVRMIIESNELLQTPLLDIFLTVVLRIIETIENQVVLIQYLNALAIFKSNNLISLPFLLLTN